MVWIIFVGKYSKLIKFIQKIDPNSRMPRIFLDSVDKSAFSIYYVISRNKLARLLYIVQLTFSLLGKNVIKMFFFAEHFWKRSDRKGWVNLIDSFFRPISPFSF